MLTANIQNWNTQERDNTHLSREILHNRYDLSTFITLPFVLPIFYEEENCKLTYNRHYFCLFFDRRDSKIKVLMNTTKNDIFWNESAYGVKLCDLLKNTHVVKNISDIRNLINHKNKVFYDNLLLLQQLFNNKNIRSFMRDVVRILNRCSLHPKSITVKDKKIGILEKINTKKSDGYEYSTMLIPIIETVKSHPRDILGKDTFLHCDNKEISPIFIYDKDGIFGFSNINFINTANYLHSRYKITHKMYDFSLDVVDKIKRIINKFL